MNRLPDVITTARLRGRRVQRDDLPYISRSDGDIRIQASVFGRTFTEDESRARIERWLQIEAESGTGFYIFSDLNGDIVGHGGVFPSRSVPGETEVGYILLPEYWNHGYATEMTLALLSHTFDEMGVQRIIAVTGPQNAPSRRVMEKAGLSFEEEFLMKDDLPAVRYAIDRERWYRRTATRTA